MATTHSDIHSPLYEFRRLHFLQSKQQPELSLPFNTESCPNAEDNKYSFKTHVQSYGLQVGCFGLVVSRWYITHRPRYAGVVVVVLFFLSLSALYISLSLLFYMAEMYTTQPVVLPSHLSNRGVVYLMPGVRFPHGKSYRRPTSSTNKQKVIARELLANK